MRRVWTADEKAQVVARYATLGATVLADALGRSPDSISSQARRYGLACPDHRKRQAHARAERSTTVNTRFFDTTTPATVFAVGYIWACGSIKTKHRKVLRIGCPRGQANNMRLVLGMLESRHQIQTYANTHVVELCNNRLVEALVARFGVPPGRQRDGSPPLLEDRLVARFAAGHLLATGSQNELHVRWSGHPSVIAWLGTKIPMLVNVPPADCGSHTARAAICWNTPQSVLCIRAWLDRLE